MNSSDTGALLNVLLLALLAGIIIQSHFVGGLIISLLAVFILAGFAKATP